MSMSLCSCEPLRKKFTRQKKRAQLEDRNFIPVLEPIEYPAPENNPQQMYKHHYAMVKVWHTDLGTLLKEKNAEKRSGYTLKQINTHIDGMRSLLQPVKQVEVDKLKQTLTYYTESLNQTGPQRNVSRLQSDLRAFYRQLYHKLRFDKVRGSLVGISK